MQVVYMYMCIVNMSGKDLLYLCTCTSLHMHVKYMYVDSVCEFASKMHVYILLQYSTMVAWWVSPSESYATGGEDK